jgi:MFS family permease
MIVNKKRRLSSNLACLLAISPLTGSFGAFCLGSVAPSNSSPRRINSFSPYKNKHRRVLVHDDNHNHIFAQSPRRPESLLLLHSQLRGGAQTKDHDDDDDEKEEILPDERRRRRGMAAALASTYLTVMGAKCALPSVLSLLTSTKTGLTFPTITGSSSTPQSHMAKLLGLSTLAVALGKLLLGPVVDTLGGIRALQVTLVLLIFLVTSISFTQQFSMFAACWIFVDFIFSSCWAGCISAIHQSFPKEEWGRQIGLLAAGARTGNALAFALFATILYALEDKMKQPWRVIFGVSALLQLLPISLLTYFGGITLKKNYAGASEYKNQQQVGEEKASFQSSLRTLRREAGTPEFWLHLISRSSLMVFASFLLFVPTLMSQVYGSSNAFAAQTGSIYALGCLLSVTLGSSKYANLPRKKQALASFLLMGGATLASLAQWAHCAGVWTLSAGMGAAFLFLWGFCFSIPFYIPPSLYALARGGKQSSATIADVFDIGGFALLAVFNGYVASIHHAHVAAWIPTFQITTACSVTSLISLTLAVLKQ